MLFLVFQLGQDRYALEATQVIEILPLVQIKPIPQAPAGVAGVFDLRGVAVPVIDLTELALGRPAERRLSTRVIVLSYPVTTGESRPLALLAEKATETTRREPADFLDSGVSNERAAYLGPVASDGRGLVQRIEVSQLLPASVRDVLFRSSVEQRCPSPTSNAC